MIIEFSIPNGNIRILAETFFAEAGMAQIRRMFKMLAESGPRGEQIDEIERCLRDHSAEMHQHMEDWSKIYTGCSMRYRELEEQYERMKSPGYAEYTQNKEKLKAARKNVISSKGIVSASKREYQTAKKMEDRYQKIIDILAAVIRQ